MTLHGAGCGAPVPVDNVCARLCTQIEGDTVLHFVAWDWTPR